MRGIGGLRTRARFLVYAKLGDARVEGKDDASNLRHRGFHKGLGVDYALRRQVHGRRISKSRAFDPKAGPICWRRQIREESSSSNKLLLTLAAEKGVIRRGRPGAPQAEKVTQVAPVIGAKEKGLGKCS